MHKKTIAAICSIILATCIQAQKPVQETKTVSEPVPVLKTINDSASYAIGVSVAKFYQQQGVKNLNTDFITKAINETFANKPLLLDDVTANDVIMQYLGRLDLEKAQPNILAGEKFLAANKKKAGVITTASGLQYEILKTGTGPVPQLTDSVLCHYKGALLDGTEVDNSYKRDEPVLFAVNGVIKGWTEALQLMPAGSAWRLYIPYNLGYGTSDYGPMPGGSLLTFEIELLEVRKQ
jgi:FKBP-type peptidyl-prolyl cis-trans isomerase